MKTKNYFELLKISGVIIILISSLSSIGQVTSNPNQGGLNQLNYGDFIELQKNTATRELKPSDYKGSPYLNNNFLNGYIIMNDTVQYKDVPLRYNIFNEQIEYKISDTSYLAIYNPESISEVMIDGKKFIYTDKRKKRFKTKGFYEVLYDGDFKLLVKYHVDFKFEQRALGYNTFKPARFLRRVNTFYFKTGDKKPIKVSRKNQFKSVFNKIFTSIAKDYSGADKKEKIVEYSKSIEAGLRKKQKKVLEKQVNAFVSKL